MSLRDLSISSKFDISLSSIVIPGVITVLILISSISTNGFVSRTSSGLHIREGCETRSDRGGEVDEKNVEDSESRRDRAKLVDAPRSTS